MMNRMTDYLAALAFGAILGVWGCWIQANDEHIADVGECMVKTAKVQNISTQEAFIICERQQ